MLGSFKEYLKLLTYALNIKTALGISAPFDIGSIPYDIRASCSACRNMQEDAKKSS